MRMLTLTCPKKNKSLNKKFPCMRFRNKIKMYKEIISDVLMVLLFMAAIFLLSLIL